MNYPLFRRKAGNIDGLFFARVLLHSKIYQVSTYFSLPAKGITMANELKWKNKKKETKQ